MNVSTPVSPQGVQLLNLQLPPKLKDEQWLPPLLPKESIASLEEPEGFPIYLSNIPENTGVSNVFGAVRKQVGEFKSLNLVRIKLGVCKLILEKEETRNKILEKPINLFGVSIKAGLEPPTEKTVKYYCVYMAGLPQTNANQLLGAIRASIGEFVAMNKLSIDYGARNGGFSKITFASEKDQHALLTKGLTVCARPIYLSKQPFPEQLKPEECRSLRPSIFDTIDRPPRRRDVERRGEVRRFYDCRPPRVDRKYFRTREDDLRLADRPVKRQRWLREAEYRDDSPPRQVIRDDSRILDRRRREPLEDIPLVLRSRFREDSLPPFRRPIIVDELSWKRDEQVSSEKVAVVTDKDEEIHRLRVENLRLREENLKLREAKLEDEFAVLKSQKKQQERAREMEIEIREKLVVQPKIDHL